MTPQSRTYQRLMTNTLTVCLSVMWLLFQKQRPFTWISSFDLSFLQSSLNSCEWLDCFIWSWCLQDRWHFYLVPFCLLDVGSDIYLWILINAGVIKENYNRITSLTKLIDVNDWSYHSISSSPNTSVSSRRPASFLYYQVIVFHRLLTPLWWPGDG